jgi:hypothetical protein
MITEEEQKQISEAMIKIARQENLNLEKIKFCAYYKGTRKRLGVCSHKKGDDSYIIRLHLLKATFVEDVNGNYNTKDGKKWIRKTHGTPILFDEVVKTAAHELAHIKYFNHKVHHKIYTNELYEKLKNVLGESWQKKVTQSMEALIVATE